MYINLSLSNQNIVSHLCLHFYIYHFLKLTLNQDKRITFKNNRREYLTLSTRNHVHQIYSLQKCFICRYMTNKMIRIKLLRIGIVKNPNKKPMFAIEGIQEYQSPRDCALIRYLKKNMYM